MRATALVVACAAALATACSTASELDRPILLGPPLPAVSADDVLIYVGRPGRPYDAVALVRSCATTGAVIGNHAAVEPERTLRAQASSVGADAIVERGDFTDAQSSSRCASGVAVRFRR
jgi:hypothetical protein